MSIQIKEWDVARFTNASRVAVYPNALNAWEKTNRTGYVDFSSSTCYIYDAFDFPNGRNGTYGGYSSTVKTLPLSSIKSVTISSEKKSNPSWAYNINVGDLSFISSDDFKVYATSTIDLSTSTGIGLTIDNANPSGHTYSYRLLHGSTVLASGNISTTLRIDLAPIKLDILAIIGNSNSTSLTVEFTIKGAVNTTKRKTVTAYAGTYGEPKPGKTPSLTFSGVTNSEGFIDMVTFVLDYGGISAGEGATISSARFNYRDIDWGWTLNANNNTLSGTIGSSGPVPTLINKLVRFTFKITNSRGQVYEYHLPNTFTLRKYDGVSISSLLETSRSANVVVVSASGSYSPSIGSTLKYEFSLSSGGTFIKSFTGDVPNKDATNKTWSMSLGFTELSPDKTYEIALKITDALNKSVTALIPIGGEAVAFSLGKSGAGVGVLVDDALNYDLQVGKNGIYSVGPIYSQGKLVGGGGEWEIKTQAEYNALSAAQKSDPTKLYLIKI